MIYSERKSFGVFAWGRLNALAGAALFLFGSACSSAPEEDGAPASGSEEARVEVQLADLQLASIALPNGNEVSWYELAPGLIATRERFKYPTQPTLSEMEMNGMNLSPIELHHELAPDAPVPERLVAAFDRTQMFAYNDDFGPVELAEVPVDVATSESSNTETNGEVGKLQQAAVDDSACSWTWLEPHCHLCATGQCGSWRIMWPRITGDSKFSRKASLTVAAMCVYRGTVRHVFRLRGEDIQDTFQSAGNGTRFFLNNGAHKFTLGSRVEQAAGDGYHHCAESN